MRVTGPCQSPDPELDSTSDSHTAIHIDSETSDSLPDCCAPTPELSNPTSATEEFKYYWVSNGKIFLRKTDQSQHMEIKNEFQLIKSWNSKTIYFPSMVGYNTYYTENNSNQNDGIVVYVKQGLNYVVKEHILSDATCILIEVNTDTVVIGLYRSPSFKNTSNFVNSLDNLLDTYKTHKTIAILGDINIDVSKDKTLPSHPNLFNYDGTVQSSEEHSRWSAFRPVGTRAPLMSALVMGRVCGSEWLVPLPALPTISAPLLLPFQHPHSTPASCNPCSPDCRQCNNS
ncbi:unnamed protein product, partial [Leptidea sinapis]